MGEKEPLEETAPGREQAWLGGSGRVSPGGENAPEAGQGHGAAGEGAKQVPCTVFKGTPLTRTGRRVNVIVSESSHKFDFSETPLQKMQMAYK